MIILNRKIQNWFDNQDNRMGWNSAEKRLMMSMIQYMIGSQLEVLILLRYQLLLMIITTMMMQAWSNYRRRELVAFPGFVKPLQRLVSKNNYCLSMIAKRLKYLCLYKQRVNL